MALEDRGAHPGHSEQDDQQSVDYHQSHGLGPGDLLDDRDGEEGVDAQPVGHAEGQVGDQSEQDGHQSGGQAGHGTDLRGRKPVAGHIHGCGVVAEPSEDQRVEDHDVGHREEGDDSTAHFPRQSGPAFSDAEERVQDAARPAWTARLATSLHALGASWQATCRGHDPGPSSSVRDSWESHALNGNRCSPLSDWKQFTGISERLDFDSKYS